MTKRALRIFFTLMLLSAMPAMAFEEPFVLVIDPGHGGADHGCKGKTAKEKDLTLSISQLFAAMVEEEFDDDVVVVLTREDDTALSLQERAAIANEACGDLFVSVHINSVDKKSKGRENVQGASVYTCGLHKSDANLAVAMKENSVIELEDDYTTTYQGFDPTSAESYIIFELSQSRHLEQSIQFATLAQEQLVKTAGRKDKEVRQAGFLVLWATSMPSVLVEVDFLCNPTVETFLASSEGQEKCAKALFEAFKDYYHIEKEAAQSEQQSNDN